MDHSDRCPVVSIITSCEIGANPDVITSLSRHSEHFIDLYAFHHDDTAVLPTESVAKPKSITDLACSINPAKASGTVRSWLDPSVQALCSGPHSPVRSVATNFPDVSDPSEVTRRRAVKAIANCARLAAKLGARCVEIVGGHSFKSSRPVNRRRNGSDSGPNPIFAGVSVRKARMGQLKKSLIDLEAILAKEKIEVGIALEIEPGPAYLLNSITVIKQLFNDSEIASLKRVGINVDIGHMFILEEQDEDPLKELRLPAMCTRILHFHASDHTISHFCDLEISTVHTRDQFLNWINLFYELRQRNDTSWLFTNTIAIEMEAGHSVDQAVRSARQLRRWMTEAAEIRNDLAPNQFEPAHMTSGRAVIIFVDIVSSTDLFISALNPVSMKDLLCTFVDSMACLVEDHGGFFDKFTGDGFMAVFRPKDDEPTSDGFIMDSLRCAQKIHGELFSIITNNPDLINQGIQYDGLRIGMALGDVYFGTMNRGVRSQRTAVGETVIEASRIMAESKDQKILCNDALGTSKAARAYCQRETDKDLKGLRGTRAIYRFKGITPPKSEPSP